jgi:hypothetical protein
MRRTSMIPMLLASAALIGRASEPPFAVSAPAALIDLDLGKLKGAPTCLAWSTNEGEFYLQTVDGAKMRHFILRLGSSPEAADGEPIWASTYWNWKSARTVPGHSELVIEVATRNETNQITSTNLHDKAAGVGDRNGTGAPRDMVNANIGAAQVRTLLLNGEVIGEYVNAPLVPGMTFGLVAGGAARRRIRAAQPSPDADGCHIGREAGSLRHIRRGAAGVVARWLADRLLAEDRPEDVRADARHRHAAIDEPTTSAPVLTAPGRVGRPSQPSASEGTDVARQPFGG